MGYNIVTAEYSELPQEFFKKSHALVFAQLDMSPVEQDLFALFLCRLAEDDWRAFLDSTTFEVSTVPEYSFTNAVLSEWLNVPASRLYDVVKKPAQRLAGSVVGIMNDADKSFQFNPLFTGVTYKRGVLNISPNYKLFKEFLCLSQGHSQVPHVEFRKLKSEYSKRLFTMLCRFKKQGTVLHPLALNELHGYLGMLDERGQLKKKTYVITSNFIARVIRPAIEEINSIVDHIEFKSHPTNPDCFGYLPVFEGRKIVAIEFNFKWIEGGKKSQPVHSNSLELAIFTHMSIEMCEFEKVTHEGIDALKLHMTDLMMDGFDCGIEFMQKFKSAIALLSN